MAKNNPEELSQEQLLKMVYLKLLDLDVKFDLLDRKIESLQQDVSKTAFVRSEHIKLRFDHKTNELYITEFFKIVFEGNEAILLGHMFKRSDGLPKKSAKFFPAELAGKFKKTTDGLKTAKAVHATISRIDSTIKQRTMGLEVFKITTKVFHFL
ncbi:MAG TPA: hypothetical protein VMY99_01350 [Nevskiaceae bacterium]|nr:hypothetical protein [Nevskiaceae bacterium]